MAHLRLQDLYASNILKTSNARNNIIMCYIKYSNTNSAGFFNATYYYIRNACKWIGFCVITSLLWLQIPSIHILTKACGPWEQDIWWCRTASDAGKTRMDVRSHSLRSGKHRRNPAVRTSFDIRDGSFICLRRKSIDFINLHFNQYSSPHPSGSRINISPPTDRPTYHSVPAARPMIPVRWQSSPVQNIPEGDAL